MDEEPKREPAWFTIAVGVFGVGLLAGSFWISPADGRYFLRVMGVFMMGVFVWLLVRRDMHS